MEFNVPPINMLISRKRSTPDSFSIIEKALDQKHFALGGFFDLSNAFSNNDVDNINNRIVAWYLGLDKIIVQVHKADKEVFYHIISVHFRKNSLLKLFNESGYFWF